MSNDSPAIRLSPRGLLIPEAGLSDEFAAAFHSSEAEGLFALAASSAPLNGVLAYWREFAAEYLRRLCLLPSEEPFASDSFSIPDEAEWMEWTLKAPPMEGGEYLNPTVLRQLWKRLLEWSDEKIKKLGSISAFLQEQAPRWTQVGRVSLHLAENKADPDYPFAFMVSYASGLTSAGRVRRLPLARALKEYAGSGGKTELLRLLSPLHAATERSALMADLVESSDIFHPLAWSPEEAFQFLKEVPLYEESGLLVQLPNWWRKRARPRVAVTIGSRSGGLGAKEMLNFHVSMVLGDEPLTPEEIEQLLASTDGLIQLRGEWVQVDREKLQEALDHWKEIESEVSTGGISFYKGMRLLAGVSMSGDGDLIDQGEDAAWHLVKPDEALMETLASLRDPNGLEGQAPDTLQAHLRPYQIVGLNWLWLCSSLGVGACLADDMGLGKTIQILAALLRQKEKSKSPSPSLLVVPASLIGNWKSEAARFAPSLKLFIAHSSEHPRSELEQTFNTLNTTLREIDLVVTTYGMVVRTPALATHDWDWVILDEAQAIKNPGTKQTRSVKALRGNMRVALSGTPVENRLGDLWSLFDFINPGLLGNATRFREFAKMLESEKQANYTPLRRLISPYLLRRRKTDPKIASDLPEKTEMQSYCRLTKVQAALYQRVVTALEKSLSEEVVGIRRRGVVLTALMQFKQICNHPSHFSGDQRWEPTTSGKFQRLRELCEEIASRGEKVLIFTQFRETCDPLADFLQTVFNQPGLILHGGTKVADRRDLVATFQRDDGPPFFVLSLKAGGTGLNLTAASHVIHFDRWWNPAVENQATDRAFRIGQKRNVLVHKFVTQGTIEERIDAMIREKQSMANELLEGDGSAVLTEMSNEEILRMVSLDLEKVMD